MIVGDNMNKPLLKVIVIVFLVAIGWMSGCKKAETISEADVLGTWKVVSWHSSDRLYSMCDMLGTLTFSKKDSLKDWAGVEVVFTFTCNGVPQTGYGYTRLKNLPNIEFDINGIFSLSTVFEGFVEDGRMLGRLGVFWAGSDSFRDGEWWEAVKK